jgi:hypothetical protein|tara:strand:- start:308 stop:451 length:144 start_codon:yes stop_codon:yes gene_type:complete
MKTQQLTITFPRKDVKYKEELLKLKEEDSLNISSFILQCVKREIGAL